MARVTDGLADALALVFDHDELAELDVAQRRLAIRSLLHDHGAPTSLVSAVVAVVDGYGAIDGLMRDPTVTDILVNGLEEIWVERAGRLERVSDGFSSQTELAETIERLLARGGGRVDPAKPIGDVSLPDGSRMHVVLPPLSPQGPKVSIRRFPRLPLSLSDLEARGMFDEGTRAALADAVRSRRTIAIGGGTGSGKTTLMNALLSELPDGERLITIEETPELRPTCAHHVSLVARPPNVEKVGEITLVELMRTALRMRPDRVVVGEVRGPEALVALDAFSTGHAGSMVTVHARSAADVCERLVVLAASVGAIDERTLRRRFDDAFDLIVQVERSNDRRRVVELVER